TAQGERLAFNEHSGREYLKELYNEDSAEWRAAKFQIDHIKHLNRLLMILNIRNFSKDALNVIREFYSRKAEFDQRLLTKTDDLTLSQKRELFESALQDSYHEVPDSYRKVIFTENDYHYYQHCKDQIATVLNKEHNVEEILGHLQKIPF